MTLSHPNFRSTVKLRISVMLAAKTSKTIDAVQQRLLRLRLSVILLNQQFPLSCLMSIIQDQNLKRIGLVYLHYAFLRNMILIEPTKKKLRFSFFDLNRLFANTSTQGLTPLTSIQKVSLRPDLLPCTNEIKRNTRKS